MKKNHKTKRSRSYCRKFGMSLKKASLGGFSILAFCAQTEAANIAIDSAAARAQILNGVTEVGHPGTSYTGHLAVYGDNAFSVTQNGSFRPIMAAASWEQSRVFAFGRTNWNEFDTQSPSGDMATLYLNVVQWASKSTSYDIKIVSDDAGTVSYLQSQGFTDVTYNSSWENSALTGVDLLICLLGENASSSEQSTLNAYVQTGGGLIVTGYGNGWADHDSSETNELFETAGLGWSNGRTNHGSAAWNVAVSTDFGNARKAADILAEPNAFTSDQKSEAGQALIESGVVLDHDSPALAEFRDLLTPYLPDVSPTPSTPVSEVMAKKVATWEGSILLKTPVGDTLAHRTAFPVGQTAPRINTTRVLDAPDGHATIRIPTGLYAAPGETVTVSVPAGFETKGLRVRVGHLRTDLNDTNYYHMPYQQIYFDLDSTSVDIASPYGGLISIEAASGEDGITNASFGFDNVVEAPHYVHGVTTDAQWNAGIKNRQTPFGVLETAKTIHVIESEAHLRDFSDPEQTMQIWEDMITHIQEFYSYTTYRPLRIHHDYQPVGGFSSFPQSYSVTADMLNYKKLVNFGFGLTHHEYGHIIDPNQMHIQNFSEAAPNFGGAYASRFYGPWTYRPKFAQERVRRFASASAHNDIWATAPHSNHHEKITPFICLADHFGWAELINIVANLKQTTPANNQEKLDNWLTLYGAEVGYDVSDFFHLWKLYPSQTALDAVSSLPKWNMVETLQDRLVLHEGASVLFPSPELNDFSYDGGLSLTNLTSPTNGTLEDVGNGYLKYTPNNGFTGSDSFTYTVTNATGNTFTGAVPVAVLSEANSPKLHVGVETVGSDVWTTVTLPHNYTSPVVVAQHIQTLGLANVVTRVRNAVGNSFEVKLQRTDGSSEPVTGVTLNYYVAEEGTYDEATHGIKMEAVKWNSDVTDVSGNLTGTEFEPQHKVLNHYIDPVYLGQVMSHNDANWSTYWTNSSSLAILAGKHVGADSNTTRADETIGYIAMESGTMQFDQQYMRFGNTSTEFGVSVGSSGASVVLSREPQVTGAIAQANGLQATENAYWTAITDTNSYTGNTVGMTLLSDDGSAVPTDAAFFLTYSELSAQPAANDDVATTLAANSVVISPLSNDLQGIGSELTIISVGQGAYGDVVDNGDGTITYTPRVTGVTDSFSYTVSNGGYESSATVSVTSTLSEMDFEAVDGWPAYADNSSNTITPTTDVFGFQWSTPNTAQIRNRSDIPASGVQCLVLGSGSPDTAEVVIPGASHGLGQVTFDYACGSSSANGTLELHYRVDGGAWVQAWTTNIVGRSPDYNNKPWPFVTVNINQPGDVDFKFESTGSGSFFVDTVKVSGYSANNAPTAANDLVVTDEDTAVVIDLLANDSDDDTLSILSLSAAINGQVADNGDGTVSYTPNAGYNGPDSFSYVLEDPSGARAYADVSVTVNAGYDLVEANDDLLTIAADSSAVSVNVLSNDNVDMGLMASMLGFANKVISYDAGELGAPADPVSVAGGSWTFSDSEDNDPNTGDLTALASIDDNGSGLDAWVMSDQTQNNGKHIHYSKILSASEQVTANTSGWALEATMRFIDDYGDSHSNILMYGNGAKRFLVFFDLDGNGDLTARTFGTGASTYTLTTGGTGTAEFHDYSILYDPLTQTAAFMVDGIRLDAGNWSGQISSFSGVQWGTGSSGGRGSAAYHSVSLSIFEQSVTFASGATATYANGDVTFDPNGGYASLGAGSSVDESVEYVLVDGTGNHTTGNLTVTVSGVNDAPVVDDNSGDLAENVTMGTVVATMNATEPDAGDSVTYAITAGNTGGAFSIDSNSGVITTATELDHETSANYTLTVSGTDTNGLSDNATVTVSVANVNESPQADDKVRNLAENGTAGDMVTTIFVSDQDAGDSHTFEITSGNELGLFFIESDGQIRLNQGLDYESSSQHVLTVTVTDAGGLNTTAVASVNVLNLNETPTAYDGSISITEMNSVGTVLMTIGASDPDAGDNLSYAITGGNASGLFVIDNNGQIATTTELDYETVSQHVLTVTVTDDGSLSDTATATVNVTDVNEAPVANDSSGSVAEDANIGTAVATVAASDVDAGDSLSYAIISGNTGSAFTIDSNGSITTATELDYETTSQYSLTVEVSDNSSLVDTATVTIDIADVVEITAPAIATGSSSAITQTSADIGYAITDDGGEATIVTLYYGETDGGTTAAAWENSVALGAQLTGSYETSVSALIEGTNYYYAFHASNSVGEVWGSSNSFTTEADTSPKMVRTTVNAVSSTNWTTVDLGKNYNSAVIVATPIYPDSNQVPVVTRIRNVSGSSFDVKIDRADGLTGEVNVDVSVVAVEEGVYTLAADGVQMEAVKYTSTITARKSSWNAEARSYQNSYTSPVVVGQVMSANDANWSVFWSMGSSRTNPVDASNLNVGKHVAEDSNTTRADETIGYIVIESGSGVINGVAYEAGIGADLPEGVSETTTGWDYNLSGGLASASAAAIGQSGVDGNDGGWAVLYGASPFSSTTLTVAIDEDQIANSERAHVNEQVAYIVFE